MGIRREEVGHENAYYIESRKWVLRKQSNQEQEIQ